MTTHNCSISSKSGLHPPSISPSQTSARTLSYLDSLSNPVILHSLHMAEPSENNFITLHNCLIHAFKTSSTLLIPSKPLRFSILDLSFSLYIIVALPHVRTGTSNDSCKTLVQSSCKLVALTRDLITTATLLPFATFLLHSTSSVPDSSKTHHNYLNSETCSKCIPFMQTSHSNPSSLLNTITLLLPALTFRPPLLKMLYTYILFFKHYLLPLLGQHASCHENEL